MKSMIAIPYDGGLTCTVHVRELGRSRRFYEEVLEFRHLYTVEERGWCEMKSPVQRVTVGLQQVQEMLEASGGPVLNFGVRSLEEARSLLEARGVPFDGPSVEVPGTVRLATFRDPDGNSLMMYEELCATGA